jgi:hypothetical protein
MQSSMTTPGSEFKFTCPKAKFLFLFAGFVSLYGIVYLSYLINMMTRNGAHF